MAACLETEIILFGEDEGTREICDEFGICHGGELKRSEFGRYLISDAFSKARVRGSYNTLCYLNCNILLFDDYDFPGAVRAIENLGLPSFLLSARDVYRPLEFDRRDSRERLRSQFRRSGKLDRHAAIDCFCFPKSTVS